MDTWVEPPEAKSNHNFTNDDDVHNHPGFQVFNAKRIQLFNTADDPEERHELSEKYPEVVDRLLKRLAEGNATAVPVV